MSAANKTIDKLAIIRDYYSLVETNRILTILDSTWVNLYCSIGYADLFQLTQEQLIGKTLIEVANETQNEYAIAMTESSQHYLRRLYESKSADVDGVICCNTAKGKTVYTFEAAAIEAGLYRIEFTELHISMMSDLMYIINHIKKIKKYKARVTDKNPTPKSKTAILAPIKLQEKDEIILFLLTIGKSYKEISNILTDTFKVNHTDTQIKGAIHNSLFNKYNVFSVDELILTYLRSAYSHSIPAKLITKMSYKGVLSINY